MLKEGIFPLIAVDHNPQNGLRLPTISGEIIYVMQVEQEVGKPTQLRMMWLEYTSCWLLEFACE